MTFTRYSVYDKLLHSSFQSNAGALLTNLPKALLIAIVMALFTLVFGEIGWKNGALVLVR